MDDAIPAAGKKERRPGRAAFVASEEQRATVRRMASERLVHPVIAAEIGISVPTLRKVFSEELKDRASAGGLFGAAAELIPTMPPPSQKPRRAGAGGRKPWQPSGPDREKAAVLVAAGMGPEQLARIFARTEPTIRKHFAAELDTGALRKRAEVIAAMHRNALNGNVAAQKEMLAIMDRADLTALQDQVRGKASAKPEAPAADPVGKKEQAQLDAHGVVTRGPWSALVGRKRG